MAGGERLARRTDHPVRLKETLIKKARDGAHGTGFPSNRAGEKETRRPSNTTASFVGESQRGGGNRDGN